MIGQYTSRFGPDSAGDPVGGMVWLVLSHTPGVHAPEDGNVFAHPDFGEHVAFVSRLVERGLVVGAGPIGGRTGHGMTIIRVPAAAVGDHVRAAHEQDASVVRGLLQLDVTAWHVRMAS